MSVQGRNQTVASPMTKVRSQLECPVCFNIPRDLPLPSCPSGHFVCRPCKTRVRNCPTCRQPMPANMTNSAIGALIEQVEHNCKFSDQGCQVKMLLKDLVTHEKKCPERTFICPYSGCVQLVQLGDFDCHALEGNRHSVNIQYRGHPPSGLMRFRIHENNDVCPNWAMGCIRTLDELFHVNLAYHKPSNCFAFSIWLAKSQNEASKYEANLVINGPKSKLSFDGIQISSVGNTLSVDKCLDDTENISLCIQRNLARSLSVKKYEVCLGITDNLDVGVSFKKI